MKNKTIYTVSELNSTVQKCLSSQFPLLWLEGEISNFTKASSGHIYCQLKDNKALIRSAMFSNKNRLLRFTPKNGLQVLVRGRVSVYEPRGDYQFIIEHMEEAGAGALQRAYEELKHKLQNEGLFEADKKQAIPSIAKNIGIISSPTGAAVQDAIRVIQTRFPQSSTVIYPCLVQGEKAEQSIIKAINIANQRDECDVLLLVRGGGSIEDLQAFNGESLANTIFNSTLPIISGVGHEVDFTIADFVADMRAATPSVAAEYATPESETLIEQVGSLHEKLIRLIEQTINKQKYAVDILSTQMDMHSPSQQIKNKLLKLKDIEQHLLNAFKIQLLNMHKRLEKLSFSLKSNSPVNKINSLNAQYAEKIIQLERMQKHFIQGKRSQLESLLSVLHTVSPLATLDRGYSITQSATGQTLQSSDDIQLEDDITVKLAKGSLEAKVTSKH